MFKELEYFNGFIDNFLDFISVMAFLAGIFIIISKNPVLSVLFLISLFGSISFYLIFIGVKFIGISYLLVYVGAVSILFLFILMLLNIRISELVSDTRNNIPLALLSIVAIYLPFNNLIPTKDSFDTFQSESVDYVSSISWDANISDISDIMSLGNIMYSNYFMWLLITSIILLLAMVGSIVITIKQ